MTWRQALSHYGPPTQRMLEIAEHFLVEHFGHTTDSAEQVLSEFFDRYGGNYDEEFVHRQQAWGIAAEAHFCISLKGDRGDVPRWRRDNDNLVPPREVVVYMRVHYWDVTDYGVGAAAQKRAPEPE